MGDLTPVPRDPGPSFSLDYIINGEWLGHLWFIGNLIFYYVATIAFAHKFVRHSENTGSATEIIVVSLIVTPLSSTFISLVGNKFYLGTFLFLNFCYLYRYLPYFVLGMYLWKHRDRFVSMLTFRNFVLLFGVYSAIGILSKFIVTFGISGLPLVLLSDLRSACVAMLSISFLNFIGNRGSKIISSLVDASYTIYLFHQPIILCFFVLILKRLPLSIYLSYGVLCGIVFLSSYFTHAIIIKKSPVLLFLFNGKVMSPPRSSNRIPGQAAPGCQSVPQGQS